MNGSHYIIARFISFFGFYQTQKHFGNAADEIHLLKQAEEIFGEDIWKQTEKIENVSVEYWTLRKFMVQKTKLEESTVKANITLDMLYEQRDNSLNEPYQTHLDLNKKRDELLLQSKVLIEERDGVLDKARQLKYASETSCTKIHLLSDQMDTDQILQREREKLSHYKIEFANLKEHHNTLQEKIYALDKKIIKIKVTIAKNRKDLRNETSRVYQSISQANRDVSQLTAEVSLLNFQIRKYQGKLGRHISQHTNVRLVYPEIHKNHSHIIAQIQRLRISIARHYKLIAMIEM